jgi:hypothetical protein
MRHGRRLQRIASRYCCCSTSGTSIDFTSLPAWIKRITVMLVGVSTNGTSDYSRQIGTSGGIESTRICWKCNYQLWNKCWLLHSNQLAQDLLLYDSSSASEAINAGQCFVSIGRFKWTWVSLAILMGHTNVLMLFGGGTKTLAGTLDRSTHHHSQRHRHIRCWFNQHFVRGLNMST